MKFNTFVLYSVIIIMFLNPTAIYFKNVFLLFTAHFKEMLRL